MGEPGRMGGPFRASLQKKPFKSLYSSFSEGRGYPARQKGGLGARVREAAKATVRPWTGRAAGGSRAGASLWPPQPRCLPQIGFSLRRRPGFSTIPRQFVENPAACGEFHPLKRKNA